QLPSGYMTELDLRDRVRLELEKDHVGVWPDAERHHPVEPEPHQTPTEPAAQQTPTEPPEAKATTEAPEEPAPTETVEEQASARHTGSGGATARGRRAPDEDPNAAFRPHKEDQ